MDETAILALSDADAELLLAEAIDLFAKSIRQVLRGQPPSAWNSAYGR